MTNPLKGVHSLTPSPVGRVTGSVTPPGSKSITNRAFVCAALSNGATTLTGVLDSEDTRLMAGCLERLGFDVVVDWDACRAVVVGQAGRIPSASATLDVGNSGTTARFISAMLALGQGVYVVDGVARMRERPIQDLLDALTPLGAEARSTAGTGCPPVEIRANGLRGGEVAIRGDVSSQFLSGLVLAAPYAQTPVRVSVVGRLVSVPYVTMTLAVMEAFGALPRIEWARDEANDSEEIRAIVVPPAVYEARSYAIEPDASAASYFAAAAAVTDGDVTIRGLNRRSLQGDVGFVDALERMGCRAEWNDEGVRVRGGKLRGVEIDMNAISDTVMTLAVVALFAEGPTTITRVGHIRHKETDRIAAVAAELTKLGATVEEFDDGLRITPGVPRGASIATYNDHRMAMSFALVGLRVPGVEILDPACTVKTYPRFFDDLATLTGTTYRTK